MQTRSASRRLALAQAAQRQQDEQALTAQPIDDAGNQMDLHGDVNMHAPPAVPPTGRRSRPTKTIAHRSASRRSRRPAPAAPVQTGLDGDVDMDAAVVVPAPRRRGRSTRTNARTTASGASLRSASAAPVQAAPALPVPRPTVAVPPSPQEMLFDEDGDAIMTDAAPAEDLTTVGGSTHNTAPAPSRSSANVISAPPSAPSPALYSDIDAEGETDPEVSHRLVNALATEGPAKVTTDSRASEDKRDEPARALVGDTAPAVVTATDAAVHPVAEPTVRRSTRTTRAPMRYGSLHAAEKSAKIAIKAQPKVKKVTAAKETTRRTKSSGAIPSNEAGVTAATTMAGLTLSSVPGEVGAPGVTSSPAAEPTTTGSHSTTPTAATAAAAEAQSTTNQPLVSQEKKTDTARAAKGKHVAGTQADTRAETAQVVEENTTARNLLVLAQAAEEESRRSTQEVATNTQVQAAREPTILALSQAARPRRPRAKKQPKANMMPNAVVASEPTPAKNVPSTSNRTPEVTSAPTPPTESADTSRAPSSAEPKLAAESRIWTKASRRPEPYPNAEAIAEVRAKSKEKTRAQGKSTRGRKRGAAIKDAMGDSPRKSELECDDIEEEGPPLVKMKAVQLHQPSVETPATVPTSNDVAASGSNAAAINTHGATDVQMDDVETHEGIQERQAIEPDWWTVTDFSEMSVDQILRLPRNVPVCQIRGYVEAYALYWGENAARNAAMTMEELDADNDRPAEPEKFVEVDVEQRTQESVDVQSEDPLFDCPVPDDDEDVDEVVPTAPSNIRVTPPPSAAQVDQTSAQAPSTAQTPDSAATAPAAPPSSNNGTPGSRPWWAREISNDIAPVQSCLQRTPPGPRSELRVAFRDEDLVDTQPLYDHKTAAPWDLRRPLHVQPQTDDEVEEQEGNSVEEQEDDAVEEQEDDANEREGGLPEPEHGGDEEEKGAGETEEEEEEEEGQGCDDSMRTEDANHPGGEAVAEVHTRRLNLALERHLSYQANLFLRNRAPYASAAPLWQQPKLTGPSSCPWMLG